jgi:hypothetical protein
MIMTGRGKTQKAVLKALDVCPDLGFREVKIAIYGPNYTHLQQCAVNNAIRSLCDHGLVEIYNDPVGRYVNGVRVTTPGYAVALPGRRIFTDEFETSHG